MDELIPTTRLLELIAVAEKGGHFTIEHPLIGKIPLAIFETKEIIAIARELIERRGSE